MTRTRIVLLLMLAAIGSPASAATSKSAFAWMS